MTYLDSPILDILVVAYGLLRLPTVSANQPFWNGHLKIEKLKRPLKKTALGCDFLCLLSLGVATYLNEQALWLAA